MDAVSDSDAGVIDFVNKDMIPLRVKHEAQPLADEFNVKWSPTVILDEGGAFYMIVK